LNSSSSILIPAERINYIDLDHYCSGSSSSTIGIGSRVERWKTIHGCGNLELCKIFMSLCVSGLRVISEGWMEGNVRCS
jgi:hypothetical protein